MQKVKRDEKRGSKFRFYNVTPAFIDNPEFVVANTRRIAREVGLKRFAFSLSIHPQGMPASAHAGKLADFFARMKQELDDEPGIELGILIQSIIGHGWSGHIKLTNEPWQRIVKLDGTTIQRMCPSDKRFRDYIIKAVGKFASLDPAFLLVDDDFGLRDGECCCPAHLAELNAAAGTGFENGSQLLAALEKIPASDPLKRTYENLRIETSRVFAREIRAEIDRHDPSMRCGYCMPGSGHVFAEEIARILAGGTEPFVRVANAYYLNTSTQAIAALQGTTSKRIASVKGIDEVIDESDTYPQTLRSEGATALHAHITSGILDGLSGSKLWIADFTKPNPEAAAPYEQIVHDNLGFYDELLGTVEGIAWKGPVQPVPRIKDNYDPLRPYTPSQQAEFAGNMLCRFGIPCTYEMSDRQALRMLAGGNVDYFSDQELLEFFKGGLLLDSHAAYKLAERGFACYMGCSVVEDDSFIFSRVLDTRTGKSARRMIDPSMKRLMPSTHETEELLRLYASNPGGDSQADMYAGAGATLYTNEFGARVGVTVFGPQMRAYNLLAHGQREHIVTMLDCLSDDGRMEMIVDTQQDVSARYGTCRDGTALLCVFNAGIDPLKSVELRSLRYVLSAERLSPSGEWGEVGVSDYGHGHFAIPVPLTTFETGIFKIQLK